MSVERVRRTKSDDMKDARVTRRFRANRLSRVRAHSAKFLDGRQSRRSER